MTDAKPVAELRREAHAEIEKWLRQAKIFSTNPACDNSILKLSVAAASSIDALADLAEAAEREWDEALEMARRYGGNDGGHHKAWVIDQMVRALTGDRYAAWVAAAKAGNDGPETYDWEEGIAP